MNRPNILIVEDDPEFSNFCFKALKEIYKVQKIDCGEQLTSLINQTAFDIVIAGFSGQASQQWNLLNLLTERCPETKCIICAQHPSLKDSVEAVKRGAYDYLEASATQRKILQVVENALRDDKPLICDMDPLPIDKPFDRFDFIGESPAVARLIKIIEKVAITDNTVLITGESGTGKELIARAIHNNSHRSHKPLVILNCGAIPGELLESELFGHEKGAFTGAHRSRIGRFEMADGGSIFLDEIGDMSPDLQVKLLRALQEQTFERVGGTRSILVDIRIIAATNKNLINSIREGKFREDLYYRLNVIPIQVPPLRDRKSDIPLLIDYFMKRLNGRRRRDLKAKSFSDDAMHALMHYEWPGNIRELENLIARVSVLVEGDVIQIDDLPEKIRGNCLGSQIITEPSSFPDGVSFNEAVENFQKNLILQALKQTNWVKAKAAELLKMNRTTLVEKIKKMKLDTREEEDIPTEFF